jgi:hypothetical protein
MISGGDTLLGLKFGAGLINAYCALRNRLPKRRPKLDARGYRMGPPARITVRNLLNSYNTFVDNPEVRDDPWARAYTLSLVVIKYYLGENWLTEHTEPGVGVRETLK